MHIKGAIKITSQIILRRKFLFIHEERGVFVLDKWMNFYGKYISKNHFIKFYKLKKGVLKPEISNIELTIQ